MPQQKRATTITQALKDKGLLNMYNLAASVESGNRVKAQETMGRLMLDFEELDIKKRRMTLDEQKQSLAVVEAMDSRERIKELRQAMDAGDRNKMHTLMAIWGMDQLPGNIQASDYYMDQDFESPQQQLDVFDILGGSPNEARELIALVDDLVDAGRMTSDAGEEAIKTIISVAAAGTGKQGTAAERTYSAFRNTPDNDIKSAATRFATGTAMTNDDRQAFYQAYANASPEGRKLLLADGLDATDPQKQAPIRHEYYRQFKTLRDDFKRLKEAGIKTNIWLQLGADLAAQPLFLHGDLWNLFGTVPRLVEYLISSGAVLEFEKDKSVVNDPDWVQKYITGPLKNLGIDIANLTGDAVKGMIAGAQTWKDLSPEQQALVAEVSSSSGRMLALFIKSISGAAASDSEAGRLQAMMPSIGRESHVNIAIINRAMLDLKDAQRAYYTNRANKKVANELLDAKGWERPVLGIRKMKLQKKAVEDVGKIESLNINRSELTSAINMIYRNTDLNVSEVEMIIKSMFPELADSELKSIIDAIFEQEQSDEQQP